MTMRRVIFVDDEPRILRGLRRLLEPTRAEWDTSFATSGTEALDLMARVDFDAIVTDMRMPGMDGAQLLQEVQQRHPHTVRVVLSGQSDTETRLRAAGPTHQFLTKPVDEETLRLTITRACDLRDLLRGGPVRRLVAQLHTLPTLASVERELRTELMSPEPSVRRVGELIGRDTAMTAKVLQLTNSSFFGAPRRVSSAEEAVRLLGLNVIRELALAQSVFSHYDARGVAAPMLEGLRDHAMVVGRLAHEIAVAEGLDAPVRGDAQLAGQLHDAGTIILATNLPEVYREAEEYARNHRIERWQAEVEFFGASHGEVGAYLLGIWGIPDSIVEAVAFHHRPSTAPASRGFAALGAVHVADALSFESSAAASGHAPGGEAGIPPPRIDAGYLRGLGLADRVAAWRPLIEAARRTAA